MHYWIIEHDMFETRDKDHAARRNEYNDKFIGTLEVVPVIVVQGKEIKKPSWFRETEIDIEQLTAQMGSRRNR